MVDLAGATDRRAFISNDKDMQFWTVKGNKNYSKRVPFNDLEALANAIVECFETCWPEVLVKVKQGFLEYLNNDVESAENYINETNGYIKQNGSLEAWAIKAAGKADADWFVDRVNKNLKAYSKKVSLANEYKKLYESAKRGDVMKKSLKEYAENDFTVLIATKDPDGNFSWYGYADGETAIDYKEGIYGYDTEVTDNVLPMSLDEAKAVAMNILEEAPAGDLLVGVVPYSTILNESKKKGLKEGFYSDEEREARGLNPQDGGGTCNECGCDVAGGDFYADDLDSTREIIVEYMTKEFGENPDYYNSESEIQNEVFGWDDDEWDESIRDIYSYLPDTADYLCHDCMYKACEKAVHQWYLDNFDSNEE